MAPFLQEPVVFDNFLSALNPLKTNEPESKLSRIASPLAWEGGKFQDQSEYTYQLSTDEIHEIDEALLSFQSMFVLAQVNTSLPLTSVHILA